MLENIAYVSVGFAIAFLALEGLALHSLQN